MATAFRRKDLEGMTDEQLQERAKVWRHLANRTKKHWTDADWEVLEIMGEQERRKELKVS